MAGSCRYLTEWGEGALFVEVLPGLEAVVELSEEAVEQVTLGGVVSSRRARVGAGSGSWLRTRPGGLRRPREIRHG